MDFISGYQSLLSYKYSGTPGYSNNQRGGIKIMVNPLGDLSFIISQNGGSHWWVDTGSLPDENSSYKFDFAPYQYYDVYLAKSENKVTTCVLNSVFTTYHCNPWCETNPIIKEIYCGSNPAFSYKSLIGASYNSEQDVYGDFFNGHIDYIEIYNYSEDNFIAAQNNLPLESYIFKIKFP